MIDQLAISIAQLNPTVGDIAGNVAKLRRALAEAAEQSADLVVGTELCVAGYPPEDLVLKPAFVAACQAAVRDFARETTSGPAIIVGTPWRQDGKLYNAAALLDRGQVAALRFKHELPNYGVFDEKRVFAAGPAPGPIAFRGVRLGLMICEDMWTPDPTEALQESGAELLLVINGSPFESNKRDERLSFAAARVKESGLPLLYVNQMSGQDELVFDGASFAVDADCHLRVQLPDWREAVVPTRWRRGADERWAVAVDALGADQVHCVMMPSPYTSRDSLEDAAAVAKLLGSELRTIGIEPAMQAFQEMLAPSFAARPADITEENIQSRARGVTLMALSNKFGWMVLSTGNKSEMSVGYATLYGDMCGGYAVLKDVYKMTVFSLSRWRNQARPEGFLGPAGRVMPERVITKPPSAELKPNQTDQDTLPPYGVLDDILECLVEHEMPVPEIVARGHPEEVVRMVWRMLDRAEYKRRQAPPGVKITRRAFGRDRRYPVTNAFQDSGPTPVQDPGETPRAPAPSA